MNATYIFLNIVSIANGIDRLHVQYRCLHEINPTASVVVSVLDLMCLKI
jgi:hypothetical protein